MTLNNIVAVKGSYESSKHNATKHGILSKYTVMQWENRGDYDNLLDSLIKEHSPDGATEEHLVEELAGIIWRKMRLRYAEMTTTQEALHRQINAGDALARTALLENITAATNFNVKKAFTSTTEETHAEVKKLEKYLTHWRSAAEILSSMGSYEDALAALHADDQHEWKAEYLGSRIYEFSKAVYSPDTLNHWVGNNISRYEKQLYELNSRDTVKTHLLGQAFLSRDSLERYTRYENHLDRKFEKTLSMLIRLQELRGKGFIKDHKLA